MADKVAGKAGLAGIVAGKASNKLGLRGVAGTQCNIMVCTGAAHLSAALRSEFVSSFWRNLGSR